MSIYFAVINMTNSLSNRPTLSDLQSCGRALECNVKDVEDPLVGLVRIRQRFSESVKQHLTSRPQMHRSHQSSMCGISPVMSVHVNLA